MPTYEYNCPKCGIIEVCRSITSEDIKKCPTCKSSVKKKVSLPAGFIDKNRQMNQFSDVKRAKYWRDKDGNRHRVTPADGSLSSPTVSSKRKRSDEQVAALRKSEQLKKVK